MMIPLILASKSPARQTLLKNAGLDFEAIPSFVDEDELKEKYLAQNNGQIDETLSEFLATQKALDVSKSNPEALVLGADQILLFDGKLFSKPKDKSDAFQHLSLLRNNTHKLIASVVICRENKVIWQHSAEATLKMRNFSDEFLEKYLENNGKATYQSVGGYQLEGLGAQLFETIEGDYFTILGLPLLPILEFLRSKQALEI